MKLPLTYEDIIRILPHRYPFLLVDRIIEIELGKRVVGLKNVTANEPFFQGHFPGNPIMPGVLIVEAMAQVGGVLARLSLYGEPKDNEEIKRLKQTSRNDNDICMNCDLYLKGDGKPC